MAALRNNAVHRCMFGLRRSLASQACQLSFNTRPENLERSTKPKLNNQSLSYRQDGFYFARLGQTINSRYKVIVKLGHGRHSTIWLARDLS